MESDRQIEKIIADLGKLQPLAITFKDKVRMVHFFHSGTAERFNRVLEGASESDTMKDRHRREVQLLAIVLADLHGSFPFFITLRRKMWELRLSFGKYSEVEALQLLNAAVDRMQYGNVSKMVAGLIASQMKAFIEANKAILRESERMFTEKIKVWKGEKA